jgi:hypothetical protein
MYVKDTFLLYLLLLKSTNASSRTKTSVVPVPSFTPHSSYPMSLTSFDHVILAKSSSTEHTVTKIMTNINLFYPRCAVRICRMGPRTLMCPLFVPRFTGKWIWSLKCAGRGEGKLRYPEFNLSTVPLGLPQIPRGQTCEPPGSTLWAAGD